MQTFCEENAINIAEQNHAEPHFRWREGTCAGARSLSICKGFLLDGAHTPLYFVLGRRGREEAWGKSLFLLRVCQSPL